MGNNNILWEKCNNKDSKKCKKCLLNDICTNSINKRKDLKKWKK